MSKKEGKQQNQNNNNVAHLADSRCPVCNSKATKSSFCEEHFLWFKEGLINRKGEKPKDFDKKYQAFMRRHQQAA